MTITPSQLRSDFPEFGNTTQYVDGTINFWINVAGLLLNSERWGSLLDLGTELFTAHNLVLEAQAAAEAAVGNSISNPALAPVPGLKTGNVTSKTVKDVSVAYDNSGAMEKDAGHWNLTTYGLRFIKLARMVGAGPIQIKGCNSAFGTVW